MTDPIKSEPPAYALFSRLEVALATFFGTPVAGGILMGVNYWYLGNSKARNRCFQLGVLSTLVMLLIIFSLPDALIYRLPSLLIPLLTGLGAYHLAKRYQHELLMNHLEAGGRIAPGLSVFLVALATSTIVFVLALLYTYSIPPMDFAGRVYKYGPERHEIYYNEGLDDPTMVAFAKTLSEFGYLTHEKTGLAQIHKTEDGYAVSLVIKRGYWENEGLLKELNSMRATLQAQVLKTDVSVTLVDRDVYGIHRFEL